MRIKLSPVFMLAVVSIAVLIPMSLGFTADALALSAAAVVGSTLLLDGIPSAGFSAFGQLGEVGERGANVEKEYKEVQANLKQVGDDLKAYAEQSKKEIEKHAGLTAETKAAVDDLLVKQGELNARLQAAEQALVNADRGGDSRPMSMGRYVVESDDFEANASRIARAKGAFSVGIQAAVVSTGVDSSDGVPIDPHRVPGVVTPPERRLTIRDLLSWGRTSSSSVEFVRETGFTNSADVVRENPTSEKPESTLAFELASSPVATIAHWIHASKQVLSDAAMLQSYIDGRLRYGLKLKEEAQLLKGSGVGLNIDGLYTQASAYSNPGVSISAGTSIDTLRIAMLQVQLAEYTADGLVLNPIDWAEMELTKDGENRYIFGNPMGLAGPRLWGLPVVATQSMDNGDFLTGAFQMGAQAWDREDASVMISTEDRDNFVKNMVTILAEERVALTAYRPEAFVKGTFTS